MILALAGGVGGAKLAIGLAMQLSPDNLLIVVNTGDDFTHLGLRISPDLDTVMYWLAGKNDADRGWGMAGETWNFMDALDCLGGPTWFKLGSRFGDTRRTDAPAFNGWKPISRHAVSLHPVRHRALDSTND